MNYIKYFIENKEKDYGNKPQKVFIFVVYLTRIFKKELNEIDKKSFERTNSNK